MAHPFFLNVRFVVVLRIGLQYMLNDNGIDRDDGSLHAAKIETESVAMEFDELRQNPYWIVGHRARIQKGLESRDGGHALRQGHASLSRRWKDARCVVMRIN